MAPRTAKAKKATEVTEAPKKGRGKAKVVEDVEPEVEEQDVNEKAAAPVAEKKKRGKKAAEVNGIEENGKTEDAAPPAKKGRKKNAEELIPEDKDEEKAEPMNVDDAIIDNAGEDNENGDNEIEANGDAKETGASSRGRKKQTKKEPAPKAEVKPSRGRKAKQETEPEELAEAEEKPKPAAKGRGRKAQPKAEPEPEEDKEEEAKPEPPTKGRKKATAKPIKEKSPEVEEPEADDEESQESEEPLMKKETKGRKNAGKKVQIRDDSEEKDEEAEEAPAKKRKVTKKEEKGKGDSKDDEAAEEDVPEAKPKGRGRAKKTAVEPSAEAEDDAQDATEAPNKRRRKAADDKAPVDDKKKPPPKNKAVTKYEELDFDNTSKNSEGKDWNFKISSWNVDGIRAWMKKGGLDYIEFEKPDIVCLQETKCAKDKLPEELADLPGYHAYWECSEKDGYAGVGIYTTQLAMNVQYGLQNEELDNEGRIITAEYEQFYLINTYVPNAGKKLVTLPKRLQWNEEFRKFVKELDKKKPVIICGDMNVSHKEIDLAKPKSNKKNAGFTEEERTGMTDLLGDGFVDTFRHLHPQKTGAYTFWTYMMNSRAKNVGWRLDYFIVSERLMPALCDNIIRNQVYGSDHCPIALFLHLKGADKPKE